MKPLLERWRQFLDESKADGEFQRITTKQRNRAKHDYLDLGANLHKEKGVTPRKRQSSVSAPPSALEEDMSKEVIIVIFGPTGSGKSTYKRHFVEHGWNEIITHTTRPRRSGDDNEYKFYEGKAGVEEWLERNKNEEFINANIYEGHHYGTDKKAFLEANRSVMLSDITSAEKLRSFGEDHNKKMILLHVKSWTDDPKKMQASMIQRDTPERFETWQKEMESSTVIPGAYEVSNTREAEEVIKKETKNGDVQNLMENWRAHLENVKPGITNSGLYRGVDCEERAIDIIRMHTRNVLALKAMRNGNVFTTNMKAASEYAAPYGVVLEIQCDPSSLYEVKDGDDTAKPDLLQTDNMDNVRISGVYSVKAGQWFSPEEFDRQFSNTR
tara:strand:- start:597 stop:1748 length:1152 start_codon:yes stop_codon:yes gene_type:complete